MAEPLVALMQPCAGYGVPYRKALKAFLRPTARGMNRVEFEQGTSALPRCFNMLLCDALNQSRTRPFTHLGMLHDDVAPDGPWLDVLCDELERTGADFIHAVCPIKDSKGVTSTAVDNPESPWVVRRLTLREVHGLPETFAAADVPWAAPGACLLANTGCWLMRWDRAFLEAFVDHGRRGDGQSGFRFLNRIVLMEDGQYVSQDTAEDWDFARQLHALGKSILGTRKVTLEHGHPLWHNRTGWGDWPTDLAFLEWQRCARGRLTCWTFPEEVPGWLTPAEGRALATLAKDKDVLEVGSYLGRSAVCMGQTAHELTAVDTFDGRATTQPRDTLAGFMEAVARYGLLPKLTVVVEESVRALTHLRETGATYDLAFIDGDHGKAAVLADATAARLLLRSGGLLAFHDYSPADPGVLAAVDELVAAGARLKDVADTVAVLEF